MLASDLEAYSSWKLELPATPERSKLYYLKPISIGTAYIEGLVSYICRLAEAHCVSPGILTKQEILPSFRERYSIGLGAVHEIRKDGDVISVSSQPKPMYKRNPNEQGFLAWQYLEGLKTLTLREDLTCLVLPVWIDQTLQVNEDKTGLAREVRAWCPECFQAWRNSGQPVYEPLIWSISAVTVCPEHHQPLQSLCPHCQRTHHPLTGKMQVARCSSCLSWLDTRLENPSEAELAISAEVDWHLWVARQVTTVLGSTPTVPIVKTREAIAHVIYGNEKPRPKSLTSQFIQHVQLKLLEVFANWSD